LALEIIPAAQGVGVDGLEENCFLRRIGDWHSQPRFRMGQKVVRNQRPNGAEKETMWTTEDPECPQYNQSVLHSPANA
jgi:hypothetical protein